MCMCVHVCLPARVHVLRLLVYTSDVSYQHDRHVEHVIKDRMKVFISLCMSCSVYAIVSTSHLL
jgi:hypothetical protein